MRIVTAKQGGKDWHAWRGKGLGASDAPAVMGVSPYSTRFELWAEKTGLIPRGEMNPFAVAAMRRGNELEPVAREKYEKLVGTTFPAISGEHDNFECVRASLDGFNQELNKFIEIKCPGKVDQALARKGRIPDKYAVQMQVQFAVTGAASADYVSFDGADELIVIPMIPDVKFQNEIVSEMVKFWELVQTKTPPTVDATDLDKIVSELTKQIAKTNQLALGLGAVCNAFTSQQFNLGGK